MNERTERIAIDDELIEEVTGGQGATLNQTQDCKNGTTATAPRARLKQMDEGSWLYAMSHAF